MWSHHFTPPSFQPSSILPDLQLQGINRDLLQYQALDQRLRERPGETDLLCTKTLTDTAPQLMASLGMTCDSSTLKQR